MQRRTLAAPATIPGTGLFTGKQVRCAIRPAEPGTGLLFRRVDLPGRPEIPATIDNLSTAPVHPAFEKLPPRCTRLALPDHPETAVAVTEHVLSALAGLGITDAEIELDGPELPAFDGSAAMFTILLTQVGLQNLQGHTIEPITLTEPIRIEDPTPPPHTSGTGVSPVSPSPTNRPSGTGTPPVSPSPTDTRPHILIEPRAEPGTRFTYHLDYGPDPALQPQTAEWTLSPDADPASYADQIAPARTFSLESEATAMRSLGLFAHLTPRDMLVLSPTGPIDNAFRFENEPARHKLLDLIGDLALLARPLQANITASRAGHALNHQAARHLLAFIQHM